MFSALQTQQLLSQSPVCSALSAPSVQTPAVAIWSNPRGYVRPVVTAVQSVSTEEIDSSSQIQAQEEEI